MLNTNASASLSSNKLKEITSPEIKEAAVLVGNGILLQETKNYEMAKVQIQKGIDKIKELLISDSLLNREMLINYYSLFEKFLSNVNTQQDNEKSESEIVHNLLDYPIALNNSKENFKDAYEEYFKSKIYNNDYLFQFSNKIFSFFLRAFDSGFYLTPNVFLRKDIFGQGNAKIDCLHQKYDTHKRINEKIDGLMILARSNVITMDNIDKLISFFNEVQMTFSKELSVVKPVNGGYNGNNETGGYSIVSKFNDISNKLKSNILVPKLDSIKDYFPQLSELCKKFKDLDQIFTEKLIKKESKEKLDRKKREICLFFYNTIIKWTLYDIKELSLRFLKKKVMRFENQVLYA